MILKILGVYHENQNYNNYKYLFGINSCHKLFLETLAKQFNLPANGASLVSHVVIFTLNMQGHYNQLFRACTDAETYPLGVTI